MILITPVLLVFAFIKMTDMLNPTANIQEKVINYITRINSLLCVCIYNTYYTTIIILYYKLEKVGCTVI